MSACPNSTEGGCRCPEHHPGLLEYASDPQALDDQLDKLRQPAELHIVTMPAAEACDRSMTCGCQRCVRERGARRGAPEIRQPWEPRPARRAA